MRNSRISEERKKLGLSQEELANKVGVSQKSISKYECGTRRPTYETLTLMASLFGVTTDYLMGFSDQAFPDKDLEWRFAHVQNRLGKILHDYRKKNSISDAAFAKLLNISSDLLSQIEAGIYSPSLDLLRKISEITGYSVNYLMGAESSTSTKVDSIKLGDQNCDICEVESDFHFRSRLEEQCLKYGITADNALEKLGLAKQDFIDIQYNRMPTLSELLRLSYGFNVSIDYLIGRTDIPILRLTDDELDLLLNYRDCLEPYKENIRNRAEKLSIESIKKSPDTLEQPFKKVSGK